MRNHIILVAIAVLASLTAVAAIAGAWSISHKNAGKSEPTNAAAPVSPHHITVSRVTACRSSTGSIRTEQAVGSDGGVRLYTHGEWVEFIIATVAADDGRHTWT